MAAVLLGAAAWGSTGTAAHFAPVAAGAASWSPGLLYGYGLRVVAVPAAVTLGLAEPVVAALLGGAVLGERLTAPALAGLVLVGLAIVILASAGRRINTTGPG